MVHSSASSSDLHGKLVVFVFPTTLTFYEDQPKQILSIYNPYEFPVKYKVLSNNPSKYSVPDHSEGVIQSKCYIDLTIRLKQAFSDGAKTVDKFKIELREHGNADMMGWRYVSAQLEKGPRTAREAPFYPFQSPAARTQGLETPSPPRSLHPVIYLLFVGSLVALAIPDSYFGQTSKLVAAFILGAASTLIVLHAQQ